MFEFGFLCQSAFWHGLSEEEMHRLRASGPCMGHTYVWAIHRSHELRVIHGPNSSSKNFLTCKFLVSAWLYTRDILWYDHSSSTSLSLSPSATWFKDLVIFWQQSRNLLNKESLRTMPDCSVTPGTAIVYGADKLGCASISFAVWVSKDRKPQVVIDTPGLQHFIHSIAGRGEALLWYYQPAGGLGW